MIRGAVSCCARIKIGRSMRDAGHFAIRPGVLDGVTRDGGQSRSSLAIAVDSLRHLPSKVRTQWT